MHRPDATLKKGLALRTFTKSSYCRNSKHARCKTPECSCQCHPEALIDAVVAAEAEGSIGRRR